MDDHTAAPAVRHCFVFNSRHLSAPFLLLECWRQDDHLASSTNAYDYPSLFPRAKSLVHGGQSDDRERQAPICLGNICHDR